MNIQWMNTLVQKKYAKSLKLIQLHLEEWMKIKKLILLEHKEINDFTTSINTSEKIQTFLLKIKKLKKYVIVEFQRLIKKTISKDKSISYKKSIQNTRLFQILVLELISKGEELKPFWNSRIADYSKKLWLPTETDYVELDSTYLSGYLNKMELNSLLKKNEIEHQIKNLPMTLYKSSMYSVREVMDQEVIKTRKIKLYPTKQQIYFLKQLIGGYRYTYNKTINYINNNPPTFEIKNDKKIYNLPNGRKMRNLIVKEIKHDSWFYKLPNHFLNEAVEEACFNFNQNIYKGKKFKMKFKSRYDTKETITIQKEAFIKGKNLFFSNFFMKFNKEFLENELTKTCNINKIKTIENKIKKTKRTTLKEIRGSEDFKNVMKESTLTYSRHLKHWILNIPFIDNVKNFNNRNKCAIDPGVCVPITTFSEKESLMIGKDFSDKIYLRCLKLDKLQSKMSLCNHKKKKKVKKRFHKQIKRIKDFRNEYHWKIINFLTNRYSSIRYPNFRPSQMLSNLHSKVSRKMNCFSFFMFKQRLEFKCKERNVDLEIGCEAFTTITCTLCGTFVSKIGRMIKCSNCGLEMNRDIMGSRNYYLKCYYC